MSPTHISKFQGRYEVRHVRQNGYAVADPDGQIVTEWHMFRPAAERQRIELQVQADHAKKRIKRACMCCGSGFDSEGIHNRLCLTCRHRSAEAAPHGVASRTSSLSRAR